MDFRFLSNRMKSSAFSSRPFSFLDTKERDAFALVMEILLLETGSRRSCETWQEDYNWRRPHSALGNLTPMEFLQRRIMDKMAA